MRYFRIVLSVISLIGIGVYATLGLTLFYYYSTPPESNINRVLSKVAIPAERYGLTSIYSVYSVFSQNTNPLILLDYSENDLNYKSSIFDSIDSGHVNILEDRWKKWRKMDIVYKGEGIKASFKFHGSSTTPYIAGYESLTIKSKSPINGKKKFKLITCAEMTYLHIFHNYVGKMLGLVTEDSGEIVSANSRNRIRDFYQYSIFDEDYLEREYGFRKPVIVRRNTFESSGRYWHSSDLDGVSYNIDVQSISKEDYSVWNNLHAKSGNRFYDPVYMGRFLALLQFFGDAHQITGNNDKWLVSVDKAFPVWREEGIIRPVNKHDLVENILFDKSFYSKSFEVYKRSLCDPEVLLSRNLALIEIVRRSEDFNESLDSIFDVYKGIHKVFNDNYIKIVGNHRYVRSQLRQNVESIKSFLDYGFTLVYYDGSRLKISSTRQNLLEVRLNNQIHQFYPTSYQYDEEARKIIPRINEFILEDVRGLSDLQIRDNVLNKKLKVEEDYTIVHIN
jgi:hypothetical protein